MISWLTMVSTESPPTSSTSAFGVCDTNRCVGRSEGTGWRDVCVGVRHTEIQGVPVDTLLYCTRYFTEIFYCTHRARSSRRKCVRKMPVDSLFYRANYFTVQNILLYTQGEISKAQMKPIKYYSMKSAMLSAGIKKVGFGVLLT